SADPASACRRSDDRFRRHRARQPRPRFQPCLRLLPRHRHGRGGAAPLKTLRKLGAVEAQARIFSKNRGPALVVRKGNPLGLKGLADVARTGARLAQSDAAEPAARAGNIAAVEALVGKSMADAVFAHEIKQFPGRIGVMHRDLPEALVRGYADVALTHYHLIS